MPVEQINNTTGTVLYLHHVNPTADRIDRRQRSELYLRRLRQPTGHTGTATTPLGGLVSEQDALDDWRLGGQESYLQGAALIWKRYRPCSDAWDHDHCAFCWAKFMDPDLSETHRQWVAEDPDTLVEGYTTTAEHEHGADYHWICGPCFDDFDERFEWQVLPPSD